jgi:hypothetical protein
VTGFRLCGPVSDEEIIATRSDVRTVARLSRAYGIGRWRKIKGTAPVELPDGSVVLADLHWYQAHGIGRRDVKIRPFWNEMTNSKDRFVLCVDRGDYQASLEPRKVYRALRDPAAEAKGLLRVIDESGEDYLFPEGLFVPIEVPDRAAPAFAAHAPAAR